MSFRMGSFYFGSPSALTTSTTNTEIIQQHKPANWSGEFSAYKFQFLNFAECTVKINGSDDEILIPGGAGFMTDYYDAAINTFTIKESGISYYYVGAV